MKALSVRQPRAEQIVRGLKTMDVRSWRVNYRGPLAIHASGAKRPERVRVLGFDPDEMVYGAILGVVELIEIVPLDEETYEAARAEHLSDAPFPGVPCFGWRFVDPRPLPRPLPMRGTMNLFNVSDEVLGEVIRSEHRPGGSVARHEPRRAVAGSKQQHLPYLVEEQPAPDPVRPFVLYTLPEDTGGYRVALYQWLQRDEGNPNGSPLAPGALWGIELGGDPLRAVAEHLLTAIRANGYKPTELARTARAANSLPSPFYLDETSGVRLALTFMAVKPLAKHDRIEAINSGIQDMSDEEAYYWFSKCSVGPNAARAQKALRVLLSDE